VVEQFGKLANLKNRKVVLWRVLLGRDEVPTMFRKCVTC
jgi:hypothetical protein